MKYEDLIYQFVQRGLSGKHLTAKQGNFLYSLYMQQEKIPVRLKAPNGARAIDCTLSDGRRWSIYQEWNGSWLFHVEGETHETA